MRKLQLKEIFSQRDPRWASIILGNNTSPKYTIGSHGCLITCLATYLGIYPNEINNRKELFTAGSGNLIWGKTSILGLNNVYTSPRYNDAVTPQGIAKMKSLIDEGRPLICEIDFNPATTAEEMHFVLVHGYDESKDDVFFAADPWTGSEINLDVYGGVKRAVYTFRAYDKILPFWSGEVQQGIPAWFKTLLDERGLSLDREGEFRAFWDKAVKYDNEISELKEQLKSVNVSLGDRATEIGGLIEKNLKLSEKFDDLEKKYFTADRERGEFEYKNKILTIQLDKANSDIENLNKKISELEMKNKDLQEKVDANLKRFTIMELIRAIFKR
jgi:hypothetical protein